MLFSDNEGWGCDAPCWSPCAATARRTIKPPNYGARPHLRSRMFSPSTLQAMVRAFDLGCVVKARDERGLDTARPLVS